MKKLLFPKLADLEFKAPEPTYKMLHEERSLGLPVHRQCDEVGTVLAKAFVIFWAEEYINVLGVFGKGGFEMLIISANMFHMRNSPLTNQSGLKPIFDSSAEGIKRFCSCLLMSKDSRTPSASMVFHEQSPQSTYVQCVVYHGIYVQIRWGDSYLV